MRLLVVASVTCLLAIALMPENKALAGMACTSQTWERYTVKGEEFSVSMPALPAMNTRKISLTPTIGRVQRILGSYADGVAYAIYAYEDPQHQPLDDFIAYTKSRRSRLRQWSNSTDLALNGFNGKQIGFMERNVPGVVQFFKTSNHLYQFEAVGAPVDDPRLQHFFTSLSLGKKLDGTPVTDGIGAQPAEEPDTQSEPVTSRDADQRVVVVTKPEPSYTESARQTRTSGTVILRVLFSANGGVTKVTVVSGLPSGLTEQALAAVKQIRFVPASKNGQFVSTWLQLEYNFNIY